jgi:hypothetical protein
LFLTGTLVRPQQAVDDLIPTRRLDDPWANAVVSAVAKKLLASSVNAAPWEGAA